ncbi:MAG TPA: SIMPL domain-containing protein [Calditrichia bacterium]|nr:SIMPL domain-containing protein [Calditrichota bacterium]HQV32538.1 SIMPL domain-containing protein [Calditrichia bacterium]
MRPLLLCLMLAVWSSALLGQAEQRQLLVFGSVRLEIPADRAVFSFEVEGTGSTLRAAMTDAREKTARINDKLVALSLPHIHLSTAFFESGENRENRALLSSRRDYKTWTRVTVTIDSLAILEQVVMTVSDYAPERISDIAFSLKNIETARKEALSKAVEMAFSKAQLMIRHSGAPETRATLGKTLLLEELPGPAVPFNSVSPSLNQVTVVNEALAAGGGGLFAKIIVVESKVKLVVELL